MAKSRTSPSTQAELWARLLELGDTQLTPDAAEYLLNLHFPPTDIDRMHKLAEKAREGTLTSRERGDLETYEHVGHALSIMKSKARLALGTPARRRK
jgi:hypothetical protein